MYVIICFQNWNVESLQDRKLEKVGRVSHPKTVKDTERC